MGKTHFGPGGGAVPSRPDEKMGTEKFVLSYPGYSSENNTKHQKTLRRLMKKTMTKKRRQRDINQKGE